MADRIAGITVTSSKAEIVILDHDAGDFELVDSFKLSLQKGELPEAYRVLAQQIDTRLRASGVQCTCIKATEAGKTIRTAHLESAATRGVVIAAAAAVAEVKLMKKSSASKTFGDRKVDEYLDDGQFWENEGLADIQVGMREAAFAAIATFRK